MDDDAKGNIESLKKFLIWVLNQNEKIISPFNSINITSRRNEAKISQHSGGINQKPINGRINIAQSS